MIILLWWQLASGGMEPKFMELIIWMIESKYTRCIASKCGTSGVAGSMSQLRGNIAAVATLCPV